MTTNFNFEAPIVLYIPDYSFGPSGISYFYILQGSKNLTSIWAEPTASFGSGRVFIASSSSLNIVNSDIDATRDRFNSTLWDWYSTTISGRAEQALDSEGIVDINVIF